MKKIFIILDNGYKCISLEDFFSYYSKQSPKWHFELLKKNFYRKDIAVALIAQKFLT